MKFETVITTSVISSYEPQLNEQYILVENFGSFFTTLYTYKQRFGGMAKKGVIHSKESSPATMDQTVEKKTKRTKLQRWEDFTKVVQKPLKKLLVAIARISASNPYKTVVFTIILSFGMAAVGFFTNFSLETSNNVLWSPSGSITASQSDWVNTPEVSGFIDDSRSIVAIIHANGEDVLHMDGMNHVFEAVDMVRNMGGYQEICVEEKNGQKHFTCDVLAPTGFFENHDRSMYEELVETDEDLKKMLSSFRFANGNFVNRALIIGDSFPSLTVNDFQGFLIRESIGEDINAEDMLDVNLQNELLEKAAKEFQLESAESFLIRWSIPAEEPLLTLSKKFESVVAEEILALNEKWGDSYAISVTTRSSNASELVRGILEDIPLMIGAFLIMTLFTMYSLSKCHRVKSQTSLGVGAVFCIFLSIITGYGLLFLIGVPLTSLTYLFPYAMLGLGLDANFIIMGSYQRTDPNKDVVDRIEETMEDIGMSIAMSTLTTIVAYFLGSSSAMPGVRWFCLYASPVIIVTFIYNFTFFIALVALDDKRQKASRWDFFFCFTSSRTDSEETADHPTAPETNLSCGSKLVEGYATLLLKPCTKVFVLILFAGLLGVGIWITSGIESALDGRDLLPTDSYVLKYINDLDDYGGGGAEQFQFAGVYFRDVDFSNPVVQVQMTQYVNDLVALPYITSPPLTFWLLDFILWRRGNSLVQQLDFNAQVDLFLKIDQYKDLYSRDIARDENGTITASRTFIVFDRVDPYDVNEQTDAFLAQRKVTMDQSINEGSGDSHFFTFGSIYYGWELWRILPTEVITTIVLGLAAVFIICLIFIPHPIASFILTPTVAATFIEILAVIRLAGLAMNALTAIGLITCIGLVVDYAIHICLAYFEIHDAKTRNDRVKRVITTIGASILKGGFTTFLGVLPLSLNSSLGFRTLFVTFIGITTLVSNNG